MLDFIIYDDESDDSMAVVDNDEGPQSDGDLDQRENERILPNTRLHNRLEFNDGETPVVRNTLRSDCIPQNEVCFLEPTPIESPPVINDIVDVAICKTDCAICSEHLYSSEHDNSPTLLKCGHIYHRKCIHRWVVSERKKHCPICRHICTGSNDFIPLKMLEFSIAEMNLAVPNGFLTHSKSSLRELETCKVDLEALRALHNTKTAECKRNEQHLALYQQRETTLVAKSLERETALSVQISNLQTKGLEYVTLITESKKQFEKVIKERNSIFNERKQTQKQLEQIEIANIALKNQISDLTKQVEQTKRISYQKEIKLRESFRIELEDSKGRFNLPRCDGSCREIIQNLTRSVDQFKRHAEIAQRSLDKMSSSTSTSIKRPASKSFDDDDDEIGLPGSFLNSRAQNLMSLSKHAKRTAKPLGNSKR